VDAVAAAAAAVAAGPIYVTIPCFQKHLTAAAGSHWHQHYYYHLLWQRQAPPPMLRRGCPSRRLLGRCVPNPSAAAVAAVTAGAVDSHDHYSHSPLPLVDNGAAAAAVWGSFDCGESGNVHALPTVIANSGFVENQVGSNFAPPAEVRDIVGLDGDVVADAAAAVGVVADVAVAVAVAVAASSAAAVVVVVVAVAVAVAAHVPPESFPAASGAAYTFPPAASAAGVAYTSPPASVGEQASQYAAAAAAVAAAVVAVAADDVAAANAPRNRSGVVAEARPVPSTRDASRPRCPPWPHAGRESPPPTIPPRGALGASRRP